MAERNQHLIARQILELDVPSLEHVPRVQEAVAQYLKTEGAAQVEALFDNLNSTDRVVRLERVEIDLGDLNGANWQEQLQSRLVTRLRESLTLGNSDESVQDATPERVADVLSEHGQPPWRSQEPILIQNRAADDLDLMLEQYVHFLEHGRLPWWGKVPARTWEQDVLQKLDQARQWHRVADVVARNDRARARLIRTADDTLLASMVERHFGVGEALRVLTLSRPTELPTTRYAEWRRRFWLIVLELVGNSDAITRGLELGSGLLRLRAAFTVSIAVDNDPALCSRDSALDLPAPWQGWLQAAHAASDQSHLSHPGHDHPYVQDAEQGAPLVAEASSLPFLGSALAYGVSAHSAVASRERKVEPLSDEVIHLGGAGCIILHPFLEELFRSLALLDGRQFRDEPARARAVHLLARLTFGQEVTPEHELLMPKLLCDMAWEEPLEPLELSAEEETACEELMSAVLGHWRALKSGSSQWLREQFFLRAAKLERVDAGWQLTVERRAQDVILDQLPWGLGVIQLPWRRERIFVHWMK